MRREIFRMPSDEALRLLSRSPTVHLASTNTAGEPVLRAVNAVVVDRAVVFHGSPVGEKTECIGRPAVAAADETIAQIPSWFLDPERACPASTFYRSVQVHGRLESVEAPAEKARLVEALMVRYQGAGRHAPLDAEHPLYRDALRSLLVVRLPIERIDGKAKLGQNLPPDRLLRVVEGLWRRGLPEDMRAVDVLLAANPGAPIPTFLQGPPGVRLHCALGPESLPEAVALLEGERWNEGVPSGLIARAQLNSTLWVGARDAQGALVGTARAVSEGAKHAWIHDVAVARSVRGRGIGKALVALLLDHPALRGVRAVRCVAEGAQGFYARFGFVDAAEWHRTFPAGEMIVRCGDVR